MLPGYVLRGAQVLDAGGGFRTADVHVADGRIAAVGDVGRVDDAPSIDLDGLWLLPGFVDAHAHLGWSTFDTGEALTTPVSQWVLEAAHNARRTLEAGVTHLRDAGGADAGIRESFRRGYARGPRLSISTVMLSQTGGHGDGFLAGPGHEISAQYLTPNLPGRPQCVVDGPEDMRRVVRQVLRAGSDWVKVCATGGVLSPHDHPRVPEFTLEELQVAVSEAARKGVGVMAHANAGEGIDFAIEAGVRSIEHGVWLTEEQATKMAANGCWLIPTLTVVGDVIRMGKAGELPAYATLKVRELEAVYGDAVALALEHGVPIAMGSDLLHRDQHGRNLEELPLMHRFGMSPEQVLLAATIRGAELCGVADECGTIEVGKAFDAVLLDGDPGDLGVFAQRGAVTGVFQGGDPVVVHERVAAALSPSPSPIRESAA